MGLQRDSVGSKLFIRCKFRKRNELAYCTLVVTSAGIHEAPGYPAVWYDDQEKPLFRLEGGKEWYEGEGQSANLVSHRDDANYAFKGGAVIPYKEVSGIRGTLGADYVLLQFQKQTRTPERVHIGGTNYVTIDYPPEKTAWRLARPENPRQALIELPKGFEPQVAYATAKKLIMFDTYRPQGDKFTRQCLVYEQAPDGYRLDQEIPIPWMGGVFDMYAQTGDALIEALNNRHMYATYYRFNIETRHRKLLGLVPADDVLFLQDNVIRTLDHELPTTP